MAQVTGKGHCKSCPIRHLSIFSQVPADHFDLIEGFHPIVMQYGADETVFHAGDEAVNAYTLREGLVKLSKDLPNGRTQIVRILKTGDIFGFDGFTRDNYNYTAVPLTGVEVCKLPMEQLKALKQKNADIEGEMMRRWIQHLDEAQDMMVELGAKKSNERLASFLIRWCAGRYPDEWIEMPMSRAEIGEFLGLTLETVSRVLSDWKRKSLLSEHSGKIQLLDPDGLRKEVGCYSD